MSSRICFHVQGLTNTTQSLGNILNVQLYGATTIKGSAHIGNKLPDQVQRLGITTTIAAFDFLTIAMAVTAADSFVPRDRQGENGWAREFELEIPLASPTTWTPVTRRLESMLRFLSGDTWRFTFRGGGRKPPNGMQNDKKRIANLSGVDCVSLFSGGLDSWIGVNELLKDGRVPLLVSHAYTGDRKFQEKLFPKFVGRAERFWANASPMRQFSGHDTTMRTRSLNFLAFAAVASEAIAQLRADGSVIPLYVPENGFIALNAPLTHRRVGSLSTRTTHPHYLSELHAIFQEVGIRAKIENPYRHVTKGQMLLSYKPSDGQIEDAMNTVSCGKWKRKRMQCGHCVPCIIRRSSFFAAGIQDTTPYHMTLHQAIAHGNPHTKDDVMSMALAVQPTSSSQLRKRALASGPLPMEAIERQGWFDVHQKGLYEVGKYLRSEGLVT